MQNGNRVKTVYAAVAAALYCGARECTDGTLLTVEHIVPEGMGGNHELPSASCDECRDITTIFERHFLRDMAPGDARAVEPLREAASSTSARLPEECSPKLDSFWT